MNCVTFFYTYSARGTSSI